MYYEGLLYVICSNLHMKNLSNNIVSAIKQLAGDMLLFFITYLTMLIQIWINKL